MKDWLSRSVGMNDIGWLDEVFANKALRASGNLRNFGSMCIGMMERLDTDTLAYRTINERMVASTIRDFGDQATIFERGSGVPDRREFVVIRSKA